MINGIIGRKIGMTQIFAPDGSVTPVTVIKAGPCVVVQKKSASGPDGYDAVQLGLVDDRPQKLKNVTKPMRGHFEKTGGGTYTFAGGAAATRWSARTSTTRGR